MEAADFVIRQGDTSPRIVGTLTDGAGAPIDATGGSVQLHLHGLTVANDLDLTGVVDEESENGNVVYHDWAAEETLLAGYYSGEWQVTYDNSQIETFPNAGVFLVQIVDQVA